MTGFEGSAYQLVSGVIQGRGAGVRDQGYVPGCKGCKDVIQLAELVVFVITGGGGVDIKMGQQFAGLASVFSCDQADFPQDSQGAGADVFEIADRCGYQVKCSHLTSLYRNLIGKGSLIET